MRGCEGIATSISHPQRLDGVKLDELKLEAKHTSIWFASSMRRRSTAGIWEKPYYLMPDGDEADEGYVVIREALKQDAQGCHRTIDHGWTRPLSWHQGA